ncbi:hypothetical protein HDV02_000384 [Globomyces sp. JEL0801]|nr:hypothetical protein HDV02_000384 [Globomyces sp. JEL0801]
MEDHEDYNDWLKTAKEIEERLVTLDSILDDEISNPRSALSHYSPDLLYNKPLINKLSNSSLKIKLPTPVASPGPSSGTQLDSVDILDSGDDEFLEPGVYVAIAAYTPDLELTEELPEQPMEVQLGQVIKVTSVFANNWCVGENQTTKTIGSLPLDVLVKLSNEFVLELANNETPVEELHSPIIYSPTDDQIISMKDLSSLSLDYQTHCLEMDVNQAPSIYFVWRYGGARVSVWGNFNNWSRPIPLFFDGATDLFVAFTEGEDVAHGDVCDFKFVVDDEWRYDPTMNVIEDPEDNSKYNTLVVCSYFCVGKYWEATVENVRYRIPARLIKTDTQSQNWSYAIASSISDARIQDAIEYLESLVVLNQVRDSTTRFSQDFLAPKDVKFDSGIDLYGDEKHAARIEYHQDLESVVEVVEVEDALHQDPTEEFVMVNAMSFENISIPAVEITGSYYKTEVEPTSPVSITKLESLTPEEFVADIAKLYISSSELEAAIENTDYLIEEKPKSVIEPDYLHELILRQTHTPFRRSPLALAPPLSWETVSKRPSSMSSVSSVYSECSDWQDIPLVIEEQAMYRNEGGLFSRRLDIYGNLLVAVILAIHSKLIYSIFWYSFATLRFFHAIWTLAGIIYLFSALILP